MELALFVGGFARTGEFAARLRIATEVVLAVHRRDCDHRRGVRAGVRADHGLRHAAAVLRRAIARFEGRRRIVRNCSAAVGGRRGDRRNGIRIGGSLLLTLAFALALTLCLTLGLALRIALARLLVSLTPRAARRDVASRGGCARAAVATVRRDQRSRPGSR